MSLALPQLGLLPLGELLVLSWNQRTPTASSDVSPMAFFAPNLCPDWTIGFGPLLVTSTGGGSTDSGKLSVGPAILGYYHRGPCTVGARMCNFWSVAGDFERDEVYRVIAQPLIRYQFNKN